MTGFRGRIVSLAVLTATLVVAVLVVLGHVLATRATWASAQPHANAAAENEGPNPAQANVHLSPAQATKHLPKADVARFRNLVRSMNTDLGNGDQAA